jgi:tetratricopeptide (TPR) repeat protein
MPNRSYKIILLSLALLLFAGAGRMQRALDDQRLAMIPRGEELRDAPPMLRFVTVALGGFRGLIANALWLRAMRLQDEEKFFEMVQLSDWITKLQPRLKQVWINQAWNMSYNISVKFTNPQDRWRWVQRGISLLRDEALRFNPDEALIYKELAWHFQHKLGQDLDEAHFYYKAQWIRQMTAVLGTNQNGYLELINPATEDARARAKILRETYKMDPALMKDADDHYGPLEWRLPEASSIYWANLGVKKSRPGEVKNLRQLIHQSLLISFQRGRIISVRPNGFPILGPRPQVMTRLDETFKQEMLDEPDIPNVKNARRNFIRLAIENFYAFNQLDQARHWFKVLRDTYPDDIEVQKAGGDLDAFCVQRLTGTVTDAGRDRVTAVIAGYLRSSYSYWVQGHEEDSDGLRLMARKIWISYMGRLGDDPKVLARVGLQPFVEIDKMVINDLLDPKSGIEDPALQAILRARAASLNLLPAGTNAPPRGN